MKKYYVFLAISFLALSCKKVLERNPVDSLTVNQTFSNEQNIQLYVNSFYQMVPTAQEIYGESGTLEGYYFRGTILSDLVAWTQVNPYLSGGFTSRNAQGWSWGDLRNINYFLDHLQGSPIPTDRKDYYEGIARFFRAWFYFKKIKMFGDVPWYSHTIASSDSAALNKPRDPRTLVMDSVLADINFAITNLNEQKDNSASTITKWVALALKSRICLFEGTFRKYHTELGLQATVNMWLQNAADAASQIMQSGTYAIYNTGNPARDYRTLFISENPVSTEVILAAIYNNNLKKWHNATGFYSNYGKYQPSLTNRFINTYLNIDGTRFTDEPGYDTTHFQKEVQNRDYRLQQTIHTPAYRRSDGSVAPPYLGAAVTGYQILKFSLDDPAYDLNGQCYNSIPIFRYAEVLLNYAEAKAELGQFTSTDWDNSIAVLRKRAGITNTAMPTTMDSYIKNNFYPDITSVPLMEIRRERSIELIAEGFRYDDLKRWKEGNLLEKEKDGIYVPSEGQLIDLNGDGVPDVCFVSSMPANRVPGVYYYLIDNSNVKLSEGDKGRIIWHPNISRQYQDYKYYAPIPYSQLIINPKLVQNQGWDHP